ncbi:tail fiber domain-containing protein [Burkholderia cenocepacia]|uniref:tail fiber domain-containing protein n=1 Tax=Burkholderia cenocepacia TaxID=95486 RepID=UPI002AB62DB4|nr:tail fiber domain-containing protein [Burkholderia cenocepacia]
MAKLEKVDLGAPGTGVGGDSPRSANERINRNTDVLSACVALGYSFLTDNTTLTAANVGARFGLNMGDGKTVKLPLAASVPGGANLHLFNASSPVTIGLQGNDGTQITVLNKGDWVTYSSDGGGYWHVVERGRMLPDEIVSGNLSALGKVSGYNSPNLLLNGAGELGNIGWNSGIFGAISGFYGEGSIFVNTSAINTGTWVVDASSDIPCGPGLPVTLTAEVFSRGLNAGRAYVKCEAFKSDGTYIGIVTGTPANTTKQDYVLRSATGTTPAGTAFVRVSKVADNAPNVDAFGVAFRRIKLERASGASLYSQEATIAYLGGAPAFSGRPTFGGKVPWDSGNFDPSPSVQSYTPGLGSASGSYSSVTRYGVYVKIGRMVFVSMEFNIQNAGTATGLFSTLPVAASSSCNQVLMGSEISANGKVCQARISKGSTSVSLFYADNGNVAISGTWLVISGYYLTDS